MNSQMVPKCQLIATDKKQSLKAYIEFLGFSPSWWLQMIFKSQKVHPFL